MKRTDAQIFIIGHKPLDYGYWDNSLYTPIQVGSNPDFTNLRDNRGYNIADWNPFYAESTATYWISRNYSGPDFIGQCQYRRRLQFPEDYDFEAAFKECDVIAAQPLTFGISVADQFGMCHSKEVLFDVECVIRDLYPDYMDAWEKYIVSGRTIYYSNSFVMRGEDYIDYADWLFDVLFEYVRRKGWKKPEDVLAYVKESMDRGYTPMTRGLDYQAEIGGFLSERLWTLYVQHNFSRIMHVPYTKFEGV